jgi:Zn-dependent M32 family carboxypeptidase
MSKINEKTDMLISRENKERILAFTREKIEKLRDEREHLDMQIERYEEVERVISNK